MPCVLVYIKIISTNIKYSYLCFVTTIVYYLTLLTFTFKQALGFMAITIDFPTTIEARINTKEFSIYCIGPVLWNNLPEELKTLYSINSFKYHLKQLLINN